MDFCSQQERHRGSRVIIIYVRAANNRTIRAEPFPNLRDKVPFVSLLFFTIKNNGIS